MGDNVGQLIVDGLAAIFPGQIVALQGGGAQGGALTRRDIKAALNPGMPLPVLDAYPETKAQFADATLRYANQLGGMSSQLGGDPDARPVDLNLAYNDLLARRAELTGQIEAAKDAEELRRSALQAEPSANEGLATRVAALGEGGLGVGYFETALAAVQPPPVTPGAGVLARDAARVTLGNELGLAEALKAQFPLLETADTTLLGYPLPLRTGFAVSRPKPPASIATASDLSLAETATTAIGTWAKTVTDAKAYVDARETFEAARLKAKPETWPVELGQAVGRVRIAADALAETACGAAASLQPAIAALGAGLTTIEAAGRFATVQQRIDLARANFPPALKPLDQWFGMLIKAVLDAPAPTAATFDQGVVELEKSEAAIPDALECSKLLPAVTAKSDKLKTAIKTPHSDEVLKALKGIGETLAAAAEDATGLLFTAALAKLKTVEASIAATVAARANVAATSPRAKLLSESLKGSKDALGEDLIAALYLEFGDAALDGFLQGVTGLQKGAVKDTPDFGMSPDGAAASVKALGLTIGAAGLKSLTGALGGTAVDGDQVGARNLGGMMNAGMKPKQVGDLFTAYGVGTDPAALQAVFGTAFEGDAQALGTITSKGLQGARTEGLTPDICVANLKKLTDAFPNQANLANVIRALKGSDPTAPGITDFPDLAGDEKTRMESLIKARGAANAAKRMDNLVANHFGGDPAKVKKPFYDQIVGHPNAEYIKLNAARQAWQTWNNLSPKLKATRAEPPYTQEMHDRYLSLNASGRIDTDKQLLIRTAASLQCGIEPPATPVAGRGVPVPSAQNGNVVSDASDQAHFEDRHLRSCNPLGGRSLAPDTTMPDKPKLYKSTTLWPEGTTPALLKILLKGAVAKAGKPPGTGWTEGDDSSRNFRNAGGEVAEATAFFQKDVTVDYPITVGGKTVTRQLGACVGMTRISQTTTPWPPNDSRQKQKPAFTTLSYRLTQFYPWGGLADTVPFEAMQTIKAAVGKRTWPGGGEP